jgi:hypothetical protein
MRIKNLLAGTLTSSCLVGAMTSSFAGEKQNYHFMDFSNAGDGKEQTYLKWSRRTAH